MTDVEARSRLSSILSVLEHEGEALRDLGDARLDGVLRAIDVTRSEILMVLAARDDELPHNGGGSPSS